MAFPEVGKGDGPILETLRIIARDSYFSAVEVTWMKDPAVRQQARTLLDTAALDVIFAGQPPLLMQKLNLNAEDEKERAKAIRQCKESADQAYELGACMLAVLSGPDPGEAKRARATELLVDSLKQICAYAQEKSSDRMLSITLETFDRTIDKKCLIGPTREAAAVAEAVKAEYSNFGLTLDLSHQPLLGESSHEMVITAIDHLVHVHIGNCVKSDPKHAAYGDNHPRFGIPGGENGPDEVQRFLETLVYAGYFKKNTPASRPVVSFEVKPLPGEDPELVIANAKRTLDLAWARV
jgi:sugar phosphate isomerase/epimerase